MISKTNRKLRAIEFSYADEAYPKKGPVVSSKAAPVMLRAVVSYAISEDGVVISEGREFLEDDTFTPKERATLTALIARFVPETI